MDNQTASPSAPTPSAAPSPALNPASAGNERPAAPPENLVKVEGILDIDFVNWKIIVLNTRATNVRYKYPSTSSEVFKPCVIIQDFNVFLWSPEDHFFLGMFVSDSQTCH
jgi:hypothetical protein